MQGPRGGNEEQEGGNRLVGGLVRNRIMQCKEIQSSGIIRKFFQKKEKRNRIENILKRMKREQTRKRER